jgi:hypothetical protein
MKDNYMSMHACYRTVMAGRSSDEELKKYCAWCGQEWIDGVFAERAKRWADGWKYKDDWPYRWERQLLGKELEIEYEK